MNVLIFGASGAMGRELVTQGLGRGHAILAFVRNPAKIEIRHPNLRLHQGDVADRAAVERAVQGQDEALCALGGSSLFKREPSIVIGVHNILMAMEKFGVRRFIYLSNDAVHDVRPQLSFFQRNFIAPVLLRSVAADHELNEGMIKQSSLDWIIVRPALLTKGEATGAYRSGEHINATSIIPRISRADLAQFMLNQLTEDRFIHEAPVVMY